MATMALENDVAHLRHELSTFHCDFSATTLSFFVILSFISVVVLGIRSMLKRIVEESELSTGEFYHDTRYYKPTSPSPLPPWDQGHEA